MAQTTSRRKKRPPARPSSRAPARKRPAARKRRGLSTYMRRPPLPRISELEQPALDAIGLGLVGAGLLLGFVLWTGSEGGAVGQALVDGLRFLVGAVAYLIPLFVIGTGVALAARPHLESPRRMRTGAIVLMLALTLAFAAGSLGLGPDAAAQRDLFDTGQMMDRGGVAGETLYWATSTLFSDAGAHLAFLFMFMAGALLLTGASISQLIGGVRTGAHGLRARAGDELERARADARKRTKFEEPAGEPRIAVLHHEPEEEEQPTGEVAMVAAEDEALESEEEDPLTRVEREIRGRDDVPQEPVDTSDPELFTPAGKRRSGVTESEGLSYVLPDPKLLRHSAKTSSADASNQDDIAVLLVETLGHFGIEAKTVGQVTGPRVTRHELRLAPGIKVSKVTQLKDDIAYALASTDIRILAPIPGKQAVGVEVPNKRHRMVYLGDIFRRELAEKDGKGAGSSPLSVWLGKDIAGNAVWTDLARMPHLLVAGTTGSGKSGCINTMLSSILMRATPNEVRMVLVDPKRVELNYYEDIPHLLTPVVHVPRMAANVLANLIREMESRYEVMGQARTRNIVELNRARGRERRPTAPLHPVRDRRARRPDDGRAGGGRGLDHPPRAEVARRRDPSGARDAAAVRRHHHGDDQGQRAGAHRVRGVLAARLARDPRRRRGGVPAGTGRHAVPPDRLVQAAAHPGRVHHRGRGRTRHGRVARPGASLSTRRSCSRAATCPRRPREASSPRTRTTCLEEAIRLVAQTQTASVSMVQRRLRVGYTRAGRLIDMLERRGVISGYEGSKPRQVLITEADVSRVLDDPSGSRSAPVATVADDEPRPGDPLPDDLQ